MNLAESIPIVIPRIFTGRMTDRLVLIAPLDQPAVDVVFIGVNPGLGSGPEEVLPLL